MQRIKKRINVVDLIYIFLFWSKGFLSIKNIYFISFARFYI